MKKALLFLCIFLFWVAVFGALATWCLPRAGARHAEIESRLREGRFDTVVLGHSLAVDGIDAQKLGELRGEKALNLGRAGQNSAYWYLVFKNFLMHADPRPREVLIVFDSARLTTPEKNVFGRYRADILSVSEREEPLLDELVLQKKQSFLDRWLERHSRLYLWRETLRDRVIAGLQQFVLARFLPTDNNTIKRLDAEIFDNAKMIPSLRAEAVREEAGLGREHYDFNARVGSSFLPALIQMARERGIRLVFVNMKTLNPVAEDQLAYGRELAGYLEKAGVGYLDYRFADFILPSHFIDEEHLNVEGRGIFTAHLAADLTDLDRKWKAGEPGRL